MVLISYIVLLLSIFLAIKKQNRADPSNKNQPKSYFTIWMDIMYICILAKQLAKELEDIGNGLFVSYGNFKVSLARFGVNFHNIINELLRSFG